MVGCEPIWSASTGLLLDRVMSAHDPERKWHFYPSPYMISVEIVTLRKLRSLSALHC